MADSTGMADLRAEYVTKAVTIWAQQAYVMKSLCTVQTSNADKETYYRETAAEITEPSGSAVKGIPRESAFPYGEPTWTKLSAYPLKFGMEAKISYEDKRTNDIDMISRTLEKIGRRVAKAVDDEIWETITEAVSGVPTATNINGVTIAAGDEWDSGDIANRDPIQDILNAKKEMYEENYNPDSNGYLLLSPEDYANLLGNPSIRNAGQFWTDSPTKNGTVGRLCGLTVKVSNTVTADYALVIIAKQACTWKSVVGLTVKTMEEPGIHTVIRAWEMGIGQLKEPKAVTLISNTQA